MKSNIDTETNNRQGVNQSTANRAKTSHETVRQVKAILERGSRRTRRKASSR